VLGSWILGTGGLGTGRLGAGLYIANLVVWESGLIYLLILGNEVVGIRLSVQIYTCAPTLSLNFILIAMCIQIRKQ